MYQTEFFLCIILPSSDIWEGLALTKAEQDLIERTEMRMLRWMMGTKRIEKIGREEIRATASVANTSETRKTEMVRPRGENDRGRCSNENMEDGSWWTWSYRKKGIPKLRWRDVTQNNMNETVVQREEAQD